MSIFNGSKINVKSCVYTTEVIFYRDADQWPIE